MIDVDDVRAVATRVRKWAEDRSVYGESDLTGMCAICSYRLGRLLTRRGHRPILCMNRNHAFLTIGRGEQKLIIDVTATQFDQAEEVVITNLVDKWYWKRTDWVRLPTNRKRIQKMFRDWPSEQQPI